MGEIPEVDITREFNQFKKSVYRAAKDRFIRIALRRARNSFRAARDNALEVFPYVKEEAEKLIETKDEVLADLEGWVKKTAERVEKNHGHAYITRTPQEALDIIKEIVGTGKIVVKGKSITSEELDINEKLAEWGNEVWETDLGEFIVQLLKMRPMHILAPAVNVPREKVREVFQPLSDEELPTDPVKLANFARKFLREKFTNADVGITGANVITADTGTVFLIENEGNINLSTGLPPKHIVLVGMEKILPTLKDGMRFVEVVSRYAGYEAMSYLSLISGPSKTGDIEKTIVYGAHGPQEFHVIFLDNGRTEMAKDEVIRQALRCVRCGACMYECPVYPIVTGYWGYKYMGGIGIPWTAYVAGGLEKAAPMSFTCTLCGRCVKHCPVKIDTPKIVEKIRRIMWEKGYIPKTVREMAETTAAEGKPY